MGFVSRCPELLQTSFHWADCFRGTVAHSRALYDSRIEELSFAYRFVSSPGRYRPLKIDRFVRPLRYRPRITDRFVADRLAPTASPPTVGHGINRMVSVIAKKLVSFHNLISDHCSIDVWRVRHNS